MNSFSEDPILAYSKELAIGLSGLKIDPLLDSFKIVGGAGVIKAHAKKSTGEVISVCVRANSEKIEQFDPSQMSIKERQVLCKELFNDGWSQSEIADLFSVSQALISRDLKKIREL
ncbi:helix-turn-helix domain-containing protein [Methylotuvimicrobium buryatense]|uniref:Helix-turn-helix domain-containing protein n=1 Tax=Methylotuvimicrobium buryatense TaxID=95641 RepID=A0A4P9UIQ5_METBY|nr:helix-turn-helix domain-containing protein [Methylotuvimicrobium buryatense]QCW81019.1 helix-turn-helix domain-containing protein [Methylotuvimicrobium buryatense]